MMISKRMVPQGFATTMQNHYGHHVKTNVDYIISIGDIEEDPQSAILFDKMEKTLQKIKLELQQQKNRNPKHHHVKV